MFDRFISMFSNLSTSRASAWRMSTWWARDNRASVQASLLRLLAVSFAEHLEVTPLVTQLAAEHRGLARYRLRQLAKRLASGTPLIEALEQTPDALSDEDVLSLRFAIQSGTSKAAIAEMAGRSARQIRDGKVELKQFLFYHSCLMCVVILLCLFMLAFIVPTFEKLFQEMEIRPILAHRSLVAFAMIIVSYIPFAMVLLAILLVAIWLLNPMRFFRRVLASRLFRRVAQLRTAHLLRMLATASDAGRPVPGSLSTLARYHYDSSLRAKLLYARNEVELGAEPWNSLQLAHLLAPDESQALFGSTSSGTRSWLMRRLAEAKETTADQRASILTSLIHPLIVLAMGLLVLWVAVASFGMLTQLTLSLT